MSVNTKKMSSLISTPIDLEELKGIVNRLKNLLDDPHPGLTTWCEAYGKRMQQLSDFWNADAESSEWKDKFGRVLQPIVKDEGVFQRFHRNEIVRFLLEAGPYDLTKLGLMPFNNEDRVQLVQLIGYSVNGFSELDYVPDEAKNAAEEMAAKALNKSTE